MLPNIIAAALSLAFAAYVVTSYVRKCRDRAQIRRRLGLEP